MWSLLDFLTKRYHYLLFLLLEGVGIVLLVRGNSYQTSMWLSSANTISGKCYELTSAVTAYFALRQENERLAERNMSLEEALAAAEQQIELLQPTSRELLATIPPTYTTIAAHVVQNSVSKKDNLLTINKGSADGVRRNMGVVSGDGVVGIVYLVGTHYAVVIPLLNTHSSVSCAIRQRGYFGYLSWNGNDPRYAYMEDVPRYAHYKEGDVVETSGHSSVFPPGLTVGTVLCTFNSADGLSYRVKVALATDFARLREVFVVDNSLVQEQLDVLRAAQDSLANRQSN